MSRCGKTNTWLLGLLYRMVYDPCQSLVCYPSDIKCSETNLTKLQPLIRHIPGLRDEMAKPRAYRGDRYRFSNLISYFQGAGSKIASKSCKIVIADEVDQWPPDHPKNYLDLCKRTRSYKSCMEFFVCSPTTQQGVIWQDFLKRLARLFYASLSALW